MIKQFKGKYRFLSNFYPVNITYEGIEFPSVENAYQAAKTKDEGLRYSFINISPNKAKKLGKTFLKLRDDWEDVKLDIMYKLCKAKFYNPPLRYLLLSTENQELIEGNYWGDDFWGVCTEEGKNNLGKILMKIREELKKEETIE